MEARGPGSASRWRSLDPCQDVVGADRPGHRRRSAGHAERRRRHPPRAFRPSWTTSLAASRDAKAWVANLETQERERTGIKSLKVGYNKVFGYYLEVTKANADRVPEEYIRKQTLVNAERYITPELKEYESLILNAEERIAELEAQHLPPGAGAGGGRGQRLLAIGAGAGPPGRVRRPGRGGR